MLHTGCVSYFVSITLNCYPKEDWKYLCNCCVVHVVGSNLSSPIKDTACLLQVNEEYMRVLQVLSKKLTYVAENHATKDYAALQDVIPEIEKLQIKAVSKVSLYSYCTLTLIIWCIWINLGFRGGFRV